MYKHKSRPSPLAILSLFIVSQVACRASTYLSPTATTTPDIPPTAAPESKVPQTDTDQDEPEVNSQVPVEALQSLAEISASNASDLIEIRTLSIRAPLADFFIAPEVEGFSLWVAILNDGNAPARLEHWDLYTNQRIGEMASGELLSPKSLSGTPDGGMLVTVDESSVALWDVYSGKLPFEEFEPSPWFNEAIIPSSSGMLLAVGYASTDGSVALFDLNTYQVIDVWFHEDYVTDIDFSSDGAFLASGAANGTVKVIDVGSAAEAFSVSEDDWVDSVAIEISSMIANPSGHTLATSASGAISLWDIADRTQIGALPGHASDVVGMDFSPNGELLASGDRSGQLKLWEVSSGVEILSANAGPGEIVRVAFSPDGTLLAVGTIDGTVTLWAVPE